METAYDKNQKLGKITKNSNGDCSKVKQPLSLQEQVLFNIIEIVWDIFNTTVTNSHQEILMSQLLLDDYKETVAHFCGGLPLPTPFISHVRFLSANKYVVDISTSVALLKKKLILHNYCERDQLILERYLAYLVCKRKALLFAENCKINNT